MEQQDQDLHPTTPTKNQGTITKCNQFIEKQTCSAASAETTESLAHTTPDTDTDHKNIANANEDDCCENEKLQMLSGMEAGAVGDKENEIVMTSPNAALLNSGAADLLTATGEPTLVDQTVENVVASETKLQEEPAAQPANVQQQQNTTATAAPAVVQDENAMRYQKYLDHAIRWKKVDEAWSWVDKMLTSDYQIDYQSVSALVKISLDGDSRTAKLRRGFSLLKKFLRKSKDAEEGLYNTCLDGFARLRDVQSMEQTMVDLRGHMYSARPGAVTYGTLIKAYGTFRDFNRVLLLWEEMRKTDIPPNAVTYGCMLDACVKCNHVEMAVQTFEDMKSSNLHKNTVLYTTIIKGFAKIKDLARAMKLYREMLSERVPCNVVTYNSLIDVAVRCNNMKVAAMVLQEMQASGIMPDIITFSTLVKGFCNEGNLRKALLVANEARMRRLPVDEIMFNSLLDGCAKIGDFDTGLMVFADMQRCNIAPSCVTFSILVRLYAGVNRLYDAIDLVFRQMPFVWKCLPTRAVYSCLMKACAQQGDPMNVACILKQRNALPESQINQLLRDAQATAIGCAAMMAGNPGAAALDGRKLAAANYHHLSSQHASSNAAMAAALGQHGSTSGANNGNSVRHLDQQQGGNNGLNTAGGNNGNNTQQPNVNQNQHNVNGNHQQQHNNGQNVNNANNMGGAGNNANNNGQNNVGQNNLNNMGGNNNGNNNQQLLLQQQQQQMQGQQNSAAISQHLQAQQTQLDAMMNMLAQTSGAATGVNTGNPFGNALNMHGGSSTGVVPNHAASQLSAAQFAAAANMGAAAAGGLQGSAGVNSLGAAAFGAGSGAGNHGGFGVNDEFANANPTANLAAAHMGAAAAHAHHSAATAAAARNYGAGYGHEEWAEWNKWSNASGSKRGSGASQSWKNYQNSYSAGMANALNAPGAGMGYQMDAGYDSFFNAGAFDQEFMGAANGGASGLLGGAGHQNTPSIPTTRAGEHALETAEKQKMDEKCGYHGGA
ncbi:unnamed protein product [Amoebophrya sp. A120]|nr:unnamed protein product [Amoebophrya sp. A120]|eukprot:GSA120T00008899001.1